jgi:hypothetical protein
MQHEYLCSRCSRLRVLVVSTQSCVNSWLSCLPQCRTYPFSRETVVNLLMGRGRKSAFAGQFSWLSCARKQVHMFACLFVRICLHATNSNHITCRGSKKLSLYFIEWGLQLCILGGEVCDDWSCASQWHCAGSIAAKHACTRPRIHAISGFKVTFSCTLLIMQLLRLPRWRMRRVKPHQSITLSRMHCNQAIMQTAPHWWDLLHFLCGPILR